jgi:hypothetical protein
MNLMYIQAKHLKLHKKGQIRALESSLLSFVNINEQLWEIMGNYEQLWEIMGNYGQL